MRACYNHQKYKNCYKIFESLKEEDLHNCKASLNRKIKLAVGNPYTMYLLKNKEHLLSTLQTLKCTN